MPGWASTLQKAAAYIGSSRAGYAANNIGRLAMYAAKGGMGRTAAGAVIGGAYGAMSDNTSVLGGALMGAGIARYGGAGLLATRGVGRGMGFGAHARALGSAFGGGVANMARRDAIRARVVGRSAYMAANRGYGRIKGLF